MKTTSPLYPHEIFLMSIRIITEDAVHLQGHHHLQQHPAGMHPCQSLEIGCADAELDVESARTSIGCGELHLFAGFPERFRWGFDQTIAKHYLVFSFHVGFPHLDGKDMSLSHACTT